MTIEDVIEFLRGVQPFQDLNEETLRSIAAGIIIEFHPKGSIILRQDGPASDYLWIIKKGSVKVYVRSDSEEMVIDSRREGEAFGFLSLMSGDKSRANVAALTDTTTYLISRETMFRLIETQPVFAEYFLVSILNKYIDKSYREMRKKSLLYSGGERLLFTTPLSDLVTKEVVTAPQGVTIKEAAGIMSRSRISSLVLLDSGNIPVGIVTDRDLRDKVTAKGRSVEGPVKEIMSVSLIKAESRDYGFEALLQMMRYNIHHLLVIDNGNLKGVITNHDLMMLQGTSPISIVREIEGQQTVEGLIPASKKVNKVIELLAKEGAKASNITRIITEINDRLVRKVLEITEARLGVPPLDYCWIVFGSEGRKEQTFKTDQDNAIIYADPATPEQAEEAKVYFSAFTLLVRDSLLKCGFPLCTGNYMASNPRWCQPLKTWKDYFLKWISAPTSDAILFSVILFDFRPLHGDFTLADSLRSHLNRSIKDQEIFLKYLADMAVSLRPPLGLFKTFIVERGREHKGELNLKFKCIAPVIDMVRLFSLEKGVSETSTLERLDALHDRHAIVEELGDEIGHAFESMTLLRIHHQLEQIAAGIEPDHFINPDRLGTIERKTLKESCHLISRVQDLITKQYSPGKIL